MAELTEKQKRFADYYIESGNATESYKRAGYSYANDNIAGVEGHKLLKNPKVSAYIDENLRMKDNERIASQDEVLEFLTSVMRGEVIERVPLFVGQGMQELVDNVPTVQVRKSAAELLGKRYRLFTDNLNLGGTIGVQVVDDI
jgi:phage terminase small subunit